VDGMDALGLEESHSKRAQIHVNQELHAAGRGTSTSSARQAA
jgi:hypothetical protein